MSGPVPISDRLKRGASMLGDLWRKGVRCSEEWNVLCVESGQGKAVDCFCEPKTEFCRVKKQWLDLVVDNGRELCQGAFGLFETMGGSEWDASGLTAKIDFPEVGAHSIGPKGIMGREDMILLCEAPETLSSIVKMMKNFPGLKVEEVGEKQVVVEPAATEGEL